MASNWYNTRKAAQIAAFFAFREGEKINVLKAVKLIYLSERRFLADYEASMLRDQLVSMDNGPVNSMTLNQINGLAEYRDGWLEFVSDRADHFFSLASDKITPDDLDELSRAELRVLQATWDEFGGMNQWDLVKYTHKNCPEWEDPHGSSSPIPYSRVFKFLGKANPEELEERIITERKMLGEFQSA